MTNVPDVFPSSSVPAQPPSADDIASVKAGIRAKYGFDAPDAYVVDLITFVNAFAPPKLEYRLVFGPDTDSEHVDGQL